MTRLVERVRLRGAAFAIVEDDALHLAGMMQWQGFLSDNVVIGPQRTGRNDARRSGDAGENLTACDHCERFLIRGRGLHSRTAAGRRIRGVHQGASSRQFPAGDDAGNLVQLALGVSGRALDNGGVKRRKRVAEDRLRRETETRHEIPSEPPRAVGVVHEDQRLRRRDGDDTTLGEFVNGRAIEVLRILGRIGQRRVAALRSVEALALTQPRHRVRDRFVFQAADGLPREVAVVRVFGKIRLIRQGVLAIGFAEHDAADELLQGPAIADEACGEAVHDLWQLGSFAEPTEFLRRTAEGLAKKLLPGAIDCRAGNQRGLRGVRSGQPIGELQAPAAFESRFRFAEKLWEATRDEFARIEHIAPVENAGIADIGFEEPGDPRVVGIQNSTLGTRQILEFLCAAQSAVSAHVKIGRFWFLPLAQNICGQFCFDLMDAIVHPGEFGNCRVGFGKSAKAVSSSPKLAFGSPENVVLFQLAREFRQTKVFRALDQSNLALVTVDEVIEGRSLVWRGEDEVGQHLFLLAGGLADVVGQARLALTLSVDRFGIQQNQVDFMKAFCLGRDFYSAVVDEMFAALNATSFLRGNACDQRLVAKAAFECGFLLHQFCEAKRILVGLGPRFCVDWKGGVAAALEEAKQGVVVAL